jgi:hypothetical protein
MPQKVTGRLKTQAGIVREFTYSSIGNAKENIAAIETRYMPGSKVLSLRTE